MFIINLVDRFGNGAFETAFAADEGTAIEKAKEFMESYREGRDHIRVRRDGDKVILVTVVAYGEEIDIFAHVEPLTVRFTNALVDYDFGFVRTIETLANGWRKIGVSDLSRFDEFQTPRYASGGYQVYDNESEIPQ